MTKHLNNSGLYPKAASICALLFLLATFAQAVHICTPLRTLGAQSVVISDGYCGICAATHPPSQTAIHPPQTLLIVYSRIVQTAEAQHNSYLVLFGLNVRPPPTQA